MIHPFDQPDIREHEQPLRIGRGLEPDPLVARAQRELLRDVLHQVGQREALGLRDALFPLESRKLEQLLRQARHAVALSHRDVEVLATIGGRQIVAHPHERLEIVLHRGERRAQVVRDIGDEVAPQRVLT